VKTIDLDDLLAATNDREEVEQLRDKLFVEQQKYEEELNKYKAELAALKKSEEDLKANLETKIKEVEQQMREKEKEHINQKVAEVSVINVSNMQTDNNHQFPPLSLSPSFTCSLSQSELIGLLSVVCWCD
jgi:phage shock protein A